jgi:hypothetical protein
MAGAYAADTHRPIPLVSTKFEIELNGGLATVVTKRVFRNNEHESIEATITFPIPVHAVLYDFEARIGGRTVKATARCRSTAREVYEDAIERGKSVVLHEEVLRGVHTLSVAHIAPGTEIEVLSTWAQALSHVGGRGQIRIPMTVGDNYGRSKLADSDGLIHGGPVGMAELVVRCGDGIVSLVGGGLTEGRASVPLNAPIDLIVTDAKPRDLRGLAADGSQVLLRIEPHGSGDSPLDVAVLIATQVPWARSAPQSMPTSPSIRPLSEVLKP